MKRLKLFIYLSICLALYQPPAYAQTPEIVNKAPEIISVEPKEISPGTALKIEGYRLGVNESAKIIFLQNAREFETNFSGGSWQSANLKEGLQELNVTVPEEIMPGKCQMLVEYGGRRSNPLVTFDVLSKPKPPRLISLKPRIVAPGETLWIAGIGFNTSDKVEMIDANGNTHNVGVGTTSSADTSAFTVSQALPEGLVTLKVLEGRSGTYGESNSLTFKVSRHAAPVDIWTEDQDSAAPGQSVEIVHTSDKPLEGAEKIEFVLRQNAQEKHSFTTDFKNIILQIPDSFTPGKAMLQNRVWKRGEVSEWSEAIEYNVAEKAAEPKIWSYINIPPKAEAMFKQNGKIVAILPIFYDINPKSKIPQKLKDEDLEIFTRYWENGRFTEWKSDRNFIFKRNELKQEVFEFSLFNKPFYIGKDSPEFFPMNRDECLRIDGSYFVKSADEIRLTLSSEKETITLKPAKSSYIGLLLFKIPANIPSGDWNVTIANQKAKIEKNIHVKLRIN